jgi:hypothetical protein
LWRMSQPIEPLWREAPMSATERGRKMASMEAREDMEGLSPTADRSIVNVGMADHS